jgi:hypothetical protein
MKGHYNPQFAFDVHHLCLTGLRFRLQCDQGMLTVSHGDVLGCPIVLSASRHFLMEYSSIVDADAQVGYGPGEALVAYGYV